MKSTNYLAVIFLIVLTGCSNKYGGNYYECIALITSTSQSADAVKTIKEACAQIHPSRELSKDEMALVNVNLLSWQDATYVNITNQNKKLIVTEVVIRSAHQKGDKFSEFTSGFGFDAEVGPYRTEISTNAHRLGDSLDSGFTVLEIKGRQIK
jgi:hypothetical protein